MERITIENIGIIIISNGENKYAIIETQSLFINISINDTISLSNEALTEKMLEKFAIKN
jgi:hypothetical protein